MRRLATLLLLVGLLGACGGDEDPPAATASTASPTTEVAEGCGFVVEEQLDPASGQHLLPGAPEPSYLSDPPTSGAHQVGPPPPPGQPIARPKQVGLLEGGHVLIQHRPEVDAAPLTALADPQVLVAPNDALPAPIVATAWLTKMLCESPDVEALEQFIEQFRGSGPGH